MAVFDYGAFYIWGDNESGQLGNRKRSFVESPFPKRKFELHHNVENIHAGVDSAAVIVESLPQRKKNPDRKRKRSLSLADAQRISDDQIKADNENRMFNQQRQEKAVEEEQQRRVPLSERFRTQMSNLAYGDTTNTLKQPEPLKTAVTPVDDKKQ